MKPSLTRPRRAPLWVGTRRRSDGQIVEVWATRHTLRSRDRQVGGTTYYRPLVFIAGQIFDHMPVRCPTPEAVVDHVKRILGAP